MSPSPSQADVVVATATEIAYRKATPSKLVTEALSPQGGYMASAAITGTGFLGTPPVGQRVEAGPRVVVRFPSGTPLDQKVSSLTSTVVRLLCKDAKNVAKNVIDWLLLEQPNQYDPYAEPPKPAYFKVSDLLHGTSEDEALCKKMIKIFCRYKGSLKFRARLLNQVCLDRNVSLHAGSLQALDAMVDSAAQDMKDYPKMRQAEPMVCGVIDGYYQGGRQLIKEVNPLAEETQPEPQIVLQPLEDADEDNSDDDTVSNGGSDEDDVPAKRQKYTRES